MVNQYYRKRFLVSASNLVCLIQECKDEMIVWLYNPQLCKGMMVQKDTPAVSVLTEDKVEDKASRMLLEAKALSSGPYSMHSVHHWTWQQAMTLTTIAPARSIGVLVPPVVRISRCLCSPHTC